MGGFGLHSVFLPPNAFSLLLVEFLDLSGNNFVGTIPSELGALSKLNTLHLEKNELTSFMPSEICELKGWESIFTFITADCGGSTPDVDCSYECCSECYFTWYGFVSQMNHQLPIDRRKLRQPGKPSAVQYWTNIVWYAILGTENFNAHLHQHPINTNITSTTIEIYNLRKSWKPNELPRVDRWEWFPPIPLAQSPQAIECLMTSMNRSF